MSFAVRKIGYRAWREDAAEALFSHTRLHYYLSHRPSREGSRMVLDPPDRVRPVADVCASDDQQDLKLSRSIAGRDQTSFVNPNYHHSPLLGCTLQQRLRLL